MRGSRTIHVVKRAGASEPFSVEKLRLCLWRAMACRAEMLLHAHYLAEAIALYLRRNRRRLVTSGALLEMAVRALDQTGLGDAAEALEAHHCRRLAARGRLVLVHSTGRRSRWDRNWLTEQIHHRWGVGRSAARALSAMVEDELLPFEGPVNRQAVLDLACRRVDEFGLGPECLLTSAPARGQSVI
jgi:hypothetical protein